MESLKELLLAAKTATKEYNQAHSQQALLLAVSLSISLVAFPVPNTISAHFILEYSTLQQTCTVHHSHIITDHFTVASLTRIHPTYVLCGCQWEHWSEQKDSLLIVFFVFSLILASEGSHVCINMLVCLPTLHFQTSSCYKCALNEGVNPSTQSAPKKYLRR